MTDSGGGVTVEQVRDVQVPFFRASISDQEIADVATCLRSGWLTTGPNARKFEAEFAAAVGARHAVALNSCTAALHLAVEAIGLTQGQAVLVPTMTFAATAEVVRYQGAIPILVDCDPETGNIDLADAADKVALVNGGSFDCIARGLRVVGILPVHVGGHMLDLEGLDAFAQTHGLWVIEDAAHAFPAAWRRDLAAPWRVCGANTARVTCFSFYANKTITTGEGGMAVTDDQELADRMRMMSLHGLSHDAWGRFSGRGGWDYRILAPGFKYNLTDVAAALGRGQLKRAEAMRLERERVAAAYLRAFGDLEEVDMPRQTPNRVLSWHLFAIQLRLDRLTLDRNGVLEGLRSRGVSCSVHWRPLHLHPYYETMFGRGADLCPNATQRWLRILSLPIFPGMTDDEIEHVVLSLKAVCADARRAPRPSAEGCV